LVQASTRQIQEVSRAFARAHELVWQLFSGAICATTLLNKTKTITWQLTLGQANHLGVTIEADIIKQKLPGI